MRELWIAGYPSFYGGADTELDHNISLWRRHGIEVNLVPMYGAGKRMRARCEARGCHTHAYHPRVFEDKVVASFCSGNFLDALPEIALEGPPEQIVWFNCMTWTFPREVEAHRLGLIDRFGFVSRFQEQLLRQELEPLNPVRVLEGYRPHLEIDPALFRCTAPTTHFCMGRLSRDDPAKFSPDMWNIFYKVSSPLPTKTFVMGYSDRVQAHCGPPPAGLDWMTIAPSGQPVTEFYRRLHCLIHKTGGSKESYCRVVPEAYNHGVAVIVEDDFAFPELVIDGETGFRCASSDEMSFRASQLAFDEGLRRRLVTGAFEHLRSQIVQEEKAIAPWLELLS